MTRSTTSATDKRQWETHVHRNTHAYVPQWWTTMILPCRCRWGTHHPWWSLKGTSFDGQIHIPWNSAERFQMSLCKVDQVDHRCECLLQLERISSQSSFPVSQKLVWLLCQNHVVQSVSASIVMWIHRFHHYNQLVAPHPNPMFPFWRSSCHCNAWKMSVLDRRFGIVLHCHYLNIVIRALFIRSLFSKLYLMVTSNLSIPWWTSRSITRIRRMDGDELLFAVEDWECLSRRTFAATAMSEPMRQVDEIISESIAHQRESHNPQSSQTLYLRIYKTPLHNPWMHDGYPLLHALWVELSIEHAHVRIAGFVSSW